VVDGKVPAQIAKMPSIRDWHSKLVSRESDWFAWGVVTFQVFTGIHPYKGGLNGYKPVDLERRMKANASVFTPGVRLNRAVRDFSCVPGPLLDWYAATFQEGERALPPSPHQKGLPSKAAQTLRAVTTTTGLLVHEKILDGSDKAIRAFFCGIVLLESGKLVELGSRRVIGIAKSRDCEVVNAGGYWLKAEKGQEWEFTSINRTTLREEKLSFDVRARGLVRYENRLFLVTDRGLSELSLKTLGRPILAVGETWGVMTNSTSWFDGLGVQDAMGSAFLIVPFGDGSVGQIRVKELDKLRPVAAKAGNRFVALTCVDEDGNYRKLELSFTRDYKTHILWQQGTQTLDLNMAILPKGVVATVVDDGELVVFVPKSGVVNKVRDKDITTDITLFNWEDKVVYIKDGEIWSVRMKS
jgi:hypothetical protein